MSGSHILEGYIVLLGSDLGSISGKVVHGSTEVGVHTVWCVRCEGVSGVRYGVGYTLYGVCVCVCVCVRVWSRGTHCMVCEV